MGKPDPAHPTMLIATGTMAGALEDGLPFVLRAGETRVMSDHELALRFPDAFKPIEPHYGSLPEFATAERA